MMLLSMIPDTLLRILFLFCFDIHALFTIYFNHYRVLSKCDIGFTRVRGTSTDVFLFPILFHYSLLKKVLGPFSVESSSSRTFVG
jgi:hypothetical protein